MTTQPQSNASTVATLTVNLVDLIARGLYDYVSSDINEGNFGPETLVLGADPKPFQFSNSVFSRDVIAEMDRAGFKPASLGDLLTYGIENPEHQRAHPIIALVQESAIVLEGQASSRRLVVTEFRQRWGNTCVFLAVHK